MKSLMTFIFTIAVFVTSVMAEEKPNFVIVLADDVSWSSFGGVVILRAPYRAPEKDSRGIYPVE